MVCRVEVNRGTHALRIHPLLRIATAPCVAVAWRTARLHPAAVKFECAEMVCGFRLNPTCVSGYEGFVSAFVFAVATQQTIGAEQCPFGE